MNLSFQNSPDVLSTEFMETNDIDSDSKVAIVQGRDFNPREFGFTEHVPTSDQFVFYFIKKDHNLKKQYRLFECQHRDEDGKACNTIF